MIRVSGVWILILALFGPIRIGMSLRKVRRVLRDPQARLAGDEDIVSLSACAYLESKAVPEEIGVMFQNGRVVRIDVSGKGVRTANGAGVGDFEDKVKELYPGRITVEPHHYLPETGHYLFYAPASTSDRRFGMVFETEKGTITSFRTGTWKAIGLVEGCS